MEKKIDLYFLFVTNDCLYNSYNSILVLLNTIGFLFDAYNIKIHTSVLIFFFLTLCPLTLTSIKYNL